MTDPRVRYADGEVVMEGDHVLVDPARHTIAASVRFLRRSDGTPYLTPDQIKPEEW